MVVEISTYRGWKMHILDVNLAFLNGPIEEEVYVKQPPGFEVKAKEEIVYKMRKAFTDWSKHLENGTRGLIAFWQS